MLSNCTGTCSLYVELAHLNIGIVLHEQKYRALPMFISNLTSSFDDINVSVNSNWVHPPTSGNPEQIVLSERIPVTQANFFV